MTHINRTKNLDHQLFLAPPSVRFNIGQCAVQFLKVVHKPTQTGHKLALSASLASDSSDNSTVQSFDHDDQDFEVKNIFGIEMEFISRYIVENQGPEVHVSDLWIKAIDKDHIQYRGQWYDGQGNIKQKKDGILTRGTAEKFLPFAKSIVDRQKAKGLIGEIEVHAEDYGLFNEGFCMQKFETSCEKLLEIGFLHPDYLNAYELSQRFKKSSGTAPPEETSVTPNQTKAADSYTAKDNPLHYQGDDSYFSKPTTERPVVIAPPTAGRTPETPKLYLQHGEDFQKIVDQATVACDDKLDCPESVGLLIGRNSNSMYQCSTTYLGNGYFSSNSHCRPSDLPESRADLPCNGRLWVKLPETQQSKPVTLNCESIVYSSKTDQNSDPFESVDVMIFKVQEKVLRDFKKASWEETPQIGKSLTLWPSDPDQSRPGIHGVIRKKTCRAFDKRDIRDWLRDFGWDYPISYTRNCVPETMPGNSGSSLFSEDGVPQAIHSHSVTSGKSVYKMTSNYACVPVVLKKNGKSTYRRTRGCLLRTNSELESYFAKKDLARVESIDQDLQSFERKIRAHITLLNEEERKEAKALREFAVTALANRITATMDSYKHSKFAGFDHLAKDTLTAKNKRLLKSEIETYIPRFWRITRSFETGTSVRYQFQIQGEGPQYFESEEELKSLKTSFGLQQLLTPRCIAPPKQWMAKHRQDKLWWFDPKSYAPVEVEYPLDNVMRQHYILSKKLIVFPDSAPPSARPYGGLEAFKVPYKIMLHISDYFDVEKNRVQTPSYSFKFLNDNGEVIQPQDSIAKALRASLFGGLPFCE